jgi:hypothetical protein
MSPYFRIVSKPTGLEIPELLFSGIATVSLFDIHGRSVREMGMKVEHNGAIPLALGKDCSLAGGLFFIRVAPLKGTRSFMGATVKAFF